MTFRSMRGIRGTAAAILLTVTACSGGGDGHDGGGNTIHAGNAIDVAGLGVDALDTAPSLGGLLTDLVVGRIANDPPTLCNTGNYAVTVTPALPVAVGHVFAITFDDCADAKGVFRGTARATVAGLAGDPGGTAYTLDLHASGLDFTIRETTLAAHVTGALRCERQTAAGIVSHHAEAEPGTPLVLTLTDGAATAELRLTAYSVHTETTPSGGETLATGGDTATFTVTGIDGALTVAVAGSIAWIEPEPPGMGELTVTAADGTRVAVRLASGGAATLAVDDDADGEVEATVPTVWDFLH
ncbi:conserved hypothetical protein [Anaeromyxobacter sp. K]|uniref:hypothetical protein n=1 Tax=Anaeromyxobacter sp. (strain K) TaxID=447217 RepID=UPI00015F85FE|nr:hypothetical protein [Anaeromyxobacter sp. K]ACG74586.1 conserved hypothetical protein [Anaeromyxobacter sp. K]